MNIHIKQLVIASVLSVLIPVSVFAITDSSTGVCTNLKNTQLWYRSKDSASNGDVAALQKFLASKGYLKSQATGFFGTGTLSALKQYQAANGISATGYAGELTKLKIKEQSCNVAIVPTATTQPVKQTGNLGNDVVTLPKKLPDTPKMCTMEARMCPDGSMMFRDENCGWHPEKCHTEVVLSKNPTNLISPKQANIDESIRKPVPLSSSTSIGNACSLEIKICQNGKAMKRNSETCEWIVSSCDQTTGVIRTIEPSSPGVGLPTSLAPSSKSVACTLEARLCPNGSVMPRDEMCGWHPEKCNQGTGTEGIMCVKDKFTGSVTCGPGAAELQ